MGTSDDDLIVDQDPTLEGDGGPTTAKIDTGTGMTDTSASTEDSGTDSSAPPNKDTGTPDAAVPDSGNCATVSPNYLCGLDPQCGCASKQTCEVTNFNTGATSCVASGAQSRGGPCTSTGNCTEGLTCVAGACRPYCANAGKKCLTPGTGECVQLMNGSTAIPNDKVCTVTCDLLRASTVCGSNNCTYYQDVDETDCIASGPVKEYGDCSVNYCAQGLVCATSSLLSECMKWCRVGKNLDCGLGQTCKNVLGASAPFINGYTYGLCDY